jgi:biopolymer transport protein ExbD
MDELLRRKRSHEVREIPIAPILDLMVVIIFFLILSTSFVQFSKLELPPAQTSTITDPVAPTPLAPKFLAVKKNKDITVALKWGGDRPNQLTGKLPAEEFDIEARAIPFVSNLLEEFKKQYPQEKSIQLGLGANLSYQNLISVMDGIRPSIQDIVLISSEEAESLIQGTTQ